MSRLSCSWMGDVHLYAAYFFPAQEVEGFLLFIPFCRSAILHQFQHRPCLILGVPYKEILGHRCWTLAFNWTLLADPMTIPELAS